MAKKNILTNESKDVSLKKGLRIEVMCKLTIAKSKSDVIMFEIDDITLVVLYH